MAEGLQSSQARDQDDDRIADVVSSEQTSTEATPGLPSDPGGNETDVLWGPPGVVEHNVILRSGPPDGDLQGDAFLGPDGSDLRDPRARLTGTDEVPSFWNGINEGGGTAPAWAGLTSSDDDPIVVSSDDTERDRIKLLEDEQSPDAELEENED